MRRLLWNEVTSLAEERKFGDMLVETETPRRDKRGPLNTVQHVDAQIKIRTHWTASRVRVSKTWWEQLPVNHILVDDRLVPLIDDEGTVTVVSPRFFRLTLFAASRLDAMLDPYTVIGLDPHEIRGTRARQCGLSFEAPWRDIIAALKPQTQAT